MTDPRQIAYEASREEWRRLNGLPGPRPGYGGRGEEASGLAADPRLRSQMAETEHPKNITLPEAANSAIVSTALSSGDAR